MARIAPCLWFDGQADEAARFYTSIFGNSVIRGASTYGEAGHEVHGQPAGSTLLVEFDLDGQTFAALNGGPAFTFNEAISFIVRCEDQDEIDYYWSRLSEGGDAAAQQCGWLKDRFGVSWQIVPTALTDMIADPDRARAGRVMEAVLKMKRIDIAALKRACGD